jgi:hypothetical protein
MRMKADQQPPKIKKQRVNDSLHSVAKNNMGNLK